MYDNDIDAKDTKDNKCYVFFEEPLVVTSSELTLFTAFSSVFEQALNYQFGSIFNRSISGLFYLHLQQMMHGAAIRRSGEATRRRIPKPANIPITCAL